MTAAGATLYDDSGVVVDALCAPLYGVHKMPAMARLSSSLAPALLTTIAGYSRYHRVHTNRPIP